MALVRAQHYVILTDKHVADAHGSRVLRSFVDAGAVDASRLKSGESRSSGSLETREVAIKKTAGSRPVKVHFKAVASGDISKCRRMKAEVEDWMAARGCDAATCMVALGGGMVQDLCGFIAATYMRGVPFVRVPTTLVAMVDCSATDETGIDAPGGKGLVGACHRASAAYLDVDTLRTLPIRHLRDGVVSALRLGLACDRVLFNLISDNSHRLQQFDMDTLARVVRRAVAARLGAVASEPLLLRFGARVGDAIFDLMNPMLLPGECLAIGLVSELETAHISGHLADRSDIDTLRRCLHKFCLPTDVPANLEACDVTANMLASSSARDAKTDEKNEVFRIPMLRGIGVPCSPAQRSIPKTLVTKALLDHADAVSVSPGLVSGTLTVPGSKSVSNRVILLAALGVGPCRVKGLLLSEATDLMIVALRKCGVRIEWEENDNERALLIQGSDGRLALPDSELYMGNASTATRFLTTAINLIEAKGSVIVTGNPRTNERPMEGLVDALNASGCAVSYLKNSGQLPLRIDTEGRGWRGGDITLAADVSSQFISSALMSAPYAREPVTLSLENKTARVVSKQYIDITIKVMALFGVNVEQTGDHKFTVPKRRYRNPAVVRVEGDAMSASYHLAMAAVSGGTVTISNVGTGCMQADAAFCQLLAKMGCEVKQTATTTTVTGPAPPEVPSSPRGDGTAGAGSRGLRALRGAVDMNAMTDSFLTLAAVAAVARGTTRIVGVANQRHKGCDRIDAMMSQLRTVGVQCESLKDGIVVHGDPKLRNRGYLETTLLNPRGDHRVAMSCAVLACAVPGIAIVSKRCVNTTYPAFWADAERRLGAKVGPVRDRSSLPSAVSQREATVWLVGMRGVGKTVLGAEIAKSMNRPFLDLDTVFEIRHGTKIRHFVQTRSFREFRARELLLFKEFTNTHAKGHVIACGAGLIETAEAIELLKRLPVVVHLHRHIDDVAAYLATDSQRPALLKDGRYAWDCHAIWRSRAPLYAAASSYEFTIVKGDHSWARILDDAVRFLQIVTMDPVGRAGFFEADVRDNARVVRLVGGTFFLSLTYPDINTAVPKLQDLVAGNSAIELRVDLWRDWSPEFIKEQISTFRRHCCLPIVYTVRSRSQGGRFPDNEKQLFELYELGIRLGCEYIDMEHHWSRAARHRLLRHRRHAKIIASAHFKDSNGGTEVDLENTFRLCAHEGKVDVVKVVTTAYCVEDAVRLVHVAKNVRLPGDPPKIILAMGSVGQISRVFNEFLTPVTHALMPGVAAPGQLSISQIMASRKMLSIRAPLTRRMYVVGAGVGLFSMTPLLHNTAFKYLHLEHKAVAYDAKSGSDLDTISRSIFQEHGFGGAVLSAPFKTRVFPHVQKVSSAARAIGAINTIAVLEDGSLFGHNTDWSSFFQKLQPILAKRRITRGQTALVLGSGGTARAAVYALIQCGVAKQSVAVSDPFDASTARQVAEHFGVAFAADAGTLRDVRICVAAFPSEPDGSNRGAENAVEDDEKASPATYLLPSAVVQQSPVILDTRYVPLHTPLEDQAAVYGCEVIRGLDLMILQGIEQLKLWVGVEHWAMVESAAPVIDRAVRHLFYEKHCASPPRSARASRRLRPPARRLAIDGHDTKQGSVGVDGAGAAGIFGSAKSERSDPSRQAT